MYCLFDLTNLYMLMNKMNITTRYVNDEKETAIGNKLAVAHTHQSAEKLIAVSQASAGMSIGRS